MNDRQSGAWTDQEVTDNYEQCETQLLQAQVADQLTEALTLFTDSSVGPQNLVSMYELAGPARVVSLILRGYELPQAKTRYRSAKALLDIDVVLQQSDRKGELSEQIWLILAAQQDVLLQQIENDLEVLYCELDNDQTKEQREVFGRAHALIRKRAGVAVDQLLAVGEHA
jgi:hypothetical protein